METLLQLSAYALRLTVFVFAAFGAGAIYPRFAFACGLSPVFLLLRFINGFGWLGLAGLVLGLLGQLRPSALIAVLGVAALRGLADAIRMWQQRRQLLSRGCWLGRRMEPILFVLLLCNLGAALNVGLGALAPDAAQDSLWYHLACPRAWLHWHVPAAWPTVYPSSYHLHGSMLYSFALAWGDEIDASLLYALFGFLSFAVVAAYAAQWYGARAGVWAWFMSATAYATYVWFVPINTGSDLTAAMFASAGLLAALSASARPNDEPSASLEWRFAGILLGWGVVTKMTVLGYVLVPLAVTIVASRVARRIDLWRHRRSSSHSEWPYGGRAWPLLVLPLLPFALWGLRSYLFASGNPLYPMFRDILPLHKEFEITRRNIAVNTLYPFTFDGVRTMLENVPSKIEYAMMARSPGFLIHLATVLAGFWVADRRWRMFAGIGTLQWLVYLWSVGFGETIKYFALCFPVSFVFAAAMLLKFETFPHVTRWTKSLALAAFAFLLAFSYARRQIEWAQYNTVAWPYRPILARDQRLRYLATKPYGLENIDLYEQANRILPREATVLFPDNMYPFYLDRRYLWVDEDLDFFAYLRGLGIADAADLALYLADHGVTHVVAHPSHLASYPAWAQVLEEIPTTAPKATLKLYRVRR